jgi:hypothetical protein
MSHLRALAVLSEWEGDTTRAATLRRGGLMEGDSPVASLNLCRLPPNTDGIQLAHMLCGCSVGFPDAEGGPCP